MDALNKLYERKNQYKIYHKIFKFLEDNNISLHAKNAISLCLVSEEDKIGKKITLTSILFDVILAFLIIALALSINELIDNKYFLTVYVLGILLAIIILNISNNIFRIIMYEKYYHDNLRTICFTNDYKMLVINEINGRFIVEKIYNHFDDYYIKNIGWTTSIKVLNEKGTVIAVFEIVSKINNNFLVPWVLKSNSSACGYWSYKEQIKFFNENGSKLDYVDELFILNNAISAKDDPL